MIEVCMVQFEQSIDFDKYHTFVLEYNKSNNIYASHCVRPTTVTYDYIINTSKFRTYTLEGSVIAFKHQTTLPKILMECAIRGISLDFVEIIDEVPNKEHRSFNDNVIVQTIDMHKEDITKYIKKIEAPKFYVAREKSKKKCNLKYLVINRFNQNKEVEFLKGDYSQEAVVAGFLELDEAQEYCKKKNEH